MIKHRWRQNNLCGIDSKWSKMVHAFAVRGESVDHLSLCGLIRDGDDWKPTRSRFRCQCCVTAIARAKKIRDTMNRIAKLSRGWDRGI